MINELKKILYADDDEASRELIRLVLQSLGGFLVQTCDSGDQVLGAAQDFHPHLVILDVMMPKMDGPSALQVCIYDRQGHAPRTKSFK